MTALRITVVFIDDRPDHVFDPVMDWDYTYPSDMFMVRDQDSNLYEFKMDEVDTVVMERSDL